MSKVVAETHDYIMMLSVLVADLEKTACLCCALMNRKNRMAELLGDLTFTIDDIQEEYKEYILNHFRDGV